MSLVYEGPQIFSITILIMSIEFDKIFRLRIVDQAYLTIEGLLQSDTSHWGGYF